MTKAFWLAIALMASAHFKTVPQEHSIQHQRIAIDSYVRQIRCNC